MGSVPPATGRSPTLSYRRPVYISMSRLRVDESSAPRLIEAFRGRLGLVESFEGFLDLQVWQSDRDPGEVIMVSRWRDRDCFKEYMRSDAHKRSHDRIDPAVQQAIELERLEHLHTYEVVAD